MSIELIIDVKFIIRMGYCKVSSNFRIYVDN